MRNIVLGIICGLMVGTACVYWPVAAGPDAGTDGGTAYTVEAGPVYTLEDREPELDAGCEDSCPMEVNDAGSDADAGSEVGQDAGDSGTLVDSGAEPTDAGYDTGPSIECELICHVKKHKHKEHYKLNQKCLPEQGAFHHLSNHEFDFPGLCSESPYDTYHDSDTDDDSDSDTDDDSDSDTDD